MGISIQSNFLSPSLSTSDDSKSHGSSVLGIGIGIGTGGMLFCALFVFLYMRRRAQTYHFPANGGSLKPFSDNRQPSETYLYRAPVAHRVSTTSILEVPTASSHVHSSCAIEASPTFPSLDPPDATKSSTFTESSAIQDYSQSVTRDAHSTSVPPDTVNTELSGYEKPREEYGGIKDGHASDHDPIGCNSAVVCSTTSRASSRQTNPNTARRALSLQHQVVATSSTSPAADAIGRSAPSRSIYAEIEESQAPQISTSDDLCSSPGTGNDTGDGACDASPGVDDEQQL